MLKFVTNVHYRYDQNIVSHSVITHNIAMQHIWQHNFYLHQIPIYSRDEVNKQKATSKIN